LPIVLLSARIGGRGYARQRVSVLDLHLQFFIVAVDQIAADTTKDLVVLKR
jgi:hypothetical protein